jgi:UDP-galactopyranose mutase
VDKEQALPVAVVNYPNDHHYTRVTEFKHLTGQQHAKTSIVYEFPRSEGDPYYPIPKPECTALYNKYKELADTTAGVHFVGRLATYKYYNMDQVVGQALSMFDEVMGARRERVVVATRPLVTPAATAVPAVPLVVAALTGDAKNGATATKSRSGQDASRPQAE